MTDGSNLLLTFIGLFIVYTIVKRNSRTGPDLEHIPTFGFTGYLLSYVDAFKFLLNAPNRLCVAYGKHQPGVFKIATLRCWLVVLTGTHHIEELRVIPEENLIFYNRVHEPICTSLHSRGNPTLTRYMTQNLPFLLLDLREEVINVLKSLPRSPTGWTEIDPAALVLQLMTTVNNRFFLGLPSARNENFDTLSFLTARDFLNEQYTFIPNLFPGLHLSGFHHKRHFAKLLESILGERVASQLQLGSNYDLLSWLVTCGLKDTLASDLFELYRTATDSLTLHFLHLLYHLAANPKYASPVRKEVEAVIAKEGWSKASLDKMRKLDSFVKESLRISSVMSVSNIREVNRDITLSDGTHIPARTVLCVASHSRNLDAERYGSESSPPGAFEGFRFSKLYEVLTGDCTDPPRSWSDTPYPYYSLTSGSPTSDDSGHIKIGRRFQLVTTSPDFLAWGYGPHACPGRFYAAVVMKLALAQIVVGYDVRFEDGHRPENLHIGLKTLPALKAKLLVRRRER